ncbi:hypothetical protein KCU96_g71, partial [Aureobasidium melanogenum]
LFFLSSSIESLEIIVLISFLVLTIHNRRCAALGKVANSTSIQKTQLHHQEKTLQTLQVRCAGLKNRSPTAFCVEVREFPRLGCLAVHLDWPGATATSLSRPSSTLLEIIHLAFRLISSAAMSAWTTTPSSDLSLPVGWTANAVNDETSSDALNLATQHRDALVSMMQDLVSTVQSLNATVAPLDNRLSVVIEWCERYMAGIVVHANTQIANIQSAEFHIANNTEWSDQAQMDIAIIVDGITNHLSPFEGAWIWHRRFSDLFVHLRRMAGELSPPRPVTDELPPIRRRLFSHGKFDLSGNLIFQISECLSLL